MAGGFKPAEPMREPSPEVVAEVMEILAVAMGDEEFEERFGPFLPLDSAAETG